MTRPTPVILVNLRADDSSSSAVVLYSQWLAGHMGAIVHIFRSVYKSDYKKDHHELSAKQLKSEAHILSDTRKRLSQCASALGAGGLEVSTSVNWKRPTKLALEQLIDEIKPVFIVTRRPKATLLDRLALPDNDWKLVELSEIPVIYVNNPPIVSEPALVWAAVDPMVKRPEHKRLNDYIIGQAKYLAAMTKAELHLFHCFSTATKLAEIAVGLSSSEYFPVQEIQQETRDRHLVALKALADRHDIPHTHIHNLPGVAQIVLPVLAARKHPYIVVAGANNQGVVTHLIHGSTTKKLLHRISGALCIVRLPGSAQSARLSSHSEATA